MAILEAKISFDNLEAKIKAQIESLGTVCLASLAIVRDYSSSVYCAAQSKVAKQLGLEYRLLNFKSQISYSELTQEIEKLNKDSRVNGIILNKPFPESWNEEEAFSLLDPKKDIEGMSPANLGKLFLGKPTFIPPTVLSICELIKYSKLELYGKKTTIVGFSNIIGKPLALLLGDKFATVSITHIATFENQDLEFYVKNADLLISAVGKPDLIKAKWIKPGAVVIDVGTGQKDNKLSGDVEFDQAKEKAAFITPVPGGVGKLTTMFLYHNLLIAAEKQKAAK